VKHFGGKPHSRHLKKGCFQALTFLLFLIQSNPAFSTQYFGRIMTGSYLSQERFADPIDGTTANDFTTVSSRFYLKAYEITDRDIEVTTDVRDKHDFFDKFDAERLQLVSGNTFQVFQLNVRVVNPRKAYFGAAGRLLVMDSGSVGVDGAEVGYRWNMAMRSGVFAGLNPKRNDQNYFTFNRDSQIAGFYFTYQPKDSLWTRNFFLTQSLIAEQVSSHLDRLYYYNNFVYQWLAPSQVVGYLYLDFVPRTKIQNGFVSWNQEVNSRFTTTLSLMAIDSIEYSRRQGVLTTLSPSTYREGSANLSVRLAPKTNLLSTLAYGARGADGLTFGEFTVGPSTNQFFDSKISAQAAIGGRHNFNTNDAFIRTDLGYFSKSWEFGLALQKGLSVQSYGVIYHPFTGELSAARYFSRDVYGTVSIEEAMNERVTIWSGFLKVGYRFGSQDVAPLRDGAPPRRRL